MILFLKFKNSFIKLKVTLKVMKQIHYKGDIYILRQVRSAKSL